MNCPRCNNPTRGSLCNSCGHFAGPVATKPAKSSRGKRRGNAPYQRGSATSRAGAVAVADKAPTQRDRLAEFVRDSGRDWTRKELQQALHWEINVITGRVNDLIRDYYRGGNLVRRRELVVIGMRNCSVTGYYVEALAYLTYEQWRDGMLV